MTMLQPLIYPLTYPERASERDQWIVAQRPPRTTLDPRRPYALLAEHERASSGEVVPVSTLFLTNRECPWRCVMCDLWQNTLTDTVPLGAIPEQIEFALQQLPPARHIKLYNSGSFFDVQAIPPEDYSGIAALLKPFERVIVESHPALIGDRCVEFRDLLSAQLEVAMGLETVHLVALERLNKRVTLEQFAAAAERLHEQAIDLRVFVLVQPPFIRSEEALHWAQRSLDFAFDCNATAVTLIPTRAENGAMEILQQAGSFTPPDLRTFEKAVEYGVALKRGRVFADLWEIERIATCVHCRAARIARLEHINLTQSVPPVLACEHCEGGA
jgi:radical SAM enzyme (TIGR01210 family)